MSAAALSPAFEIVEMRQFAFSDGAAVHDVMVHRFSDGRISVLIEQTEHGQSMCHSLALPLDPRYARLIGAALLDFAGHDLAGETT